MAIYQYSDRIPQISRGSYVSEMLSLSGKLLLEKVAISAMEPF